MFKFFVACLLISISTIHAQEIIPGLIPRFYSIEAAVDLPISPEVAHEQAMKGFDLSTLDPDATTNIWNPNNKTIPDHQLLHTGEKVQFVKELPSRSGQLRFTVVTQDKRELIVILSKKVHSMLLRRNILSKLGYATQPMSWLANFELVFADTIDRDLLKEQMKDKLLAGTERWIKSEQDLTMQLQDALVLTPESEIYNLATGLMPSDVHQGRRLLRAPYVPLALVDTTESVNLFPWQAGRLVLNHIKLNHTQDLDTTYGTSWEDARWIGRRMARLTRQDFEEIVVKSSYPLAVEKLLIEKIIARRNDMMELLSLDTESTKIEFDPEINSGEGLVDGEIVQEFFDGYSSRFSYGDPESPFSASELGSFALSRGMSQILSEAMTQLNKLIGTSDEADYAEKMNEIIRKEGPFFPAQAVAVPTFHGSIILSRDIVTGSYLGTNNKVQLVDNFGFGIDAGIFAGIEGMLFPITIKGGGGVTFQRVYSHVKPVQSLKKSLKEPFKNMLVPMLVRDLGKKIDKLSSVSGKDQEVMVQSIAGELKAALAVGESFIITDSIVPRLFTEAELSLTHLLYFDKKLLKAYGRIQVERMMLTRFHLHRPDENTFQIYQDYGKGLKLMLTMKLKSYIPVLAFNARWNNATAETHLFPISLHPKTVTVDTLKALRMSLYALNHGPLENIVKPHKVEHKIHEGGNTIQLLMFKRNQIGSDQSMSITHAQGGEKKEIHRRYDAVTTGTDWESYATETVNNLVSMLTKSDLSLSQVQTLNPGFTLNGRAKNKIFTSEYDGSRLNTGYQRIFNGWRVNQSKLRSMLKTMNIEAGREVFNPLASINTDSILLYQISFNYTLTQEGTDKLLNTSVSEFTRVLTAYAQWPQTPERISGLADYYFRELKRIRQELSQQDPSKGMKHYHSWLKGFQDVMTIRGLEELTGKDNLAYQGKIEGFRQGDENGDNPIFSHVYGELPLPLQVSPTQAIMQNWGIIEGELLANWMMERAI